MSVHYVHAVNGDGINNVSLSTTYMLSTMAASIMSVCPLHTCCQRWHHQKCLSVHYLHAVNDDGIINVCLSTTYMLSTMTSSITSVCPLRTCCHSTKQTLSLFQTEKKILKKRQGVIHWEFVNTFFWVYLSAKIDSTAFLEKLTKYS